MVTPHGRRARVCRLTKPGRKRLKDVEESRATLTDGVRRVLRWGGEDPLVPKTAIGQRDAGGFTEAPAPEAYVIARRDEWPANAHLAFRTAASPANADASLRQIAADLDPLLPATIQTADEQVARLTQRPRFIAWLLTAFATLALLLAAAGLYSVASYMVLQRRRDIGVRMALGASPRDVAREVVREAGRWILGGALAGSALGWMGTRALQSQLYQVPALDPWSWTGALLALAMALVMAVFQACLSRRPR